MSEVVLDEVSKVHPDGTVALESIDLTVADGEFVVVVGPIGSGKSTLLRLAAVEGDTATLYATDDPVEAMSLADRIVVLDAGRLQQMGTPEEIYDRPANTFVAGYLGSPAMNLGSATLFGLSDNLVIGLRPAAFALGHAGPTCMDVTAITVERLDDQSYVLFRPAPWAPMWTAAIGPDADVVPGQNITLTVDLTLAHFFDAATGSAIAAGA